MKKGRRNFMKNSALGAVAGTFGFGSFTHASTQELVQSGKLSIESWSKSKTYKPLDTLKLKTSEPGTIKVADGNFNIYYTTPITKDATFDIGGAAGNQIIILENKDGKIIDTIVFKVAVKTEINDKKGTYNELMRLLLWSMIGEWGETSTYKYNKKLYRVFVGWLRDHTHTMKGMKYFFPYLKDGFDLYKDSQRADGLIWDNIYARTPEANWWDKVLEEGNFMMKIENDTYEFKRQPVEADMEYLFVECLYYTWKATGDNEWMQSGLDACIKAMNYATTDKYRWSQKYQLVKRGFTIDTWDFVHDYDREQTGFGGGQCISIDKNEFGIMHGDNTGMIAAFNYLSEMLQIAGRADESKKYAQLAADFKTKLDKVAWNGKYYTHYVPENEDFWKKRNIGATDPQSQVSLSNAYALNRGVTHEQAVKIINTYLKIKSEMPKTSAGEWYAIYPPFGNGFGNDNGMWEYMNAGVLTIVAGELAHGAYENGYEKYATDILKRILEIGRKHGNYLYCTYKGSLPTVPDAKYTTVTLKSVANADFYGKGAPGVPGWSNEGEINDLSEFPVGKQTFKNIPFDIVDPATNGRKAALIISKAAGYTMKAVLPIGKNAKSIYILQARSKSDLISTLKIKYTDGTEYIEYMVGHKIENWWFMSDTRGNDSYVPRSDNYKVAWRGKNKKSLNVAIGIYGLNNPNPDKTIAQLEFEGMNNSDAKWFINGITLSDQPVYFDQGDVSFGIPDRWGAAACMYALVEGLAGVKDTGVAFDKVKLSPKWNIADENEVEATIAYEASGGYVTYKYKNSDTSLELLYTGSGSSAAVEILVPESKNVSKIVVNGATATFQTKMVEQTKYAVFNINKIGVNRISVNW
ncbi:MAG: hypothetical protein NW207_11345 [Cytophagales bacterium]|nr:hypothetical protein [Cytophagales bacterium]